MKKVDMKYLSQRALETKARIEKSEEISRWSKELSGKLYYALWILFMGGFAYSLNYPSQQQLRLNIINVVLIHIFRILAIVGSALNFLLQKLSIDSAQYAAYIINEFERYSAEILLGKLDKAEAALTEAEALSMRKAIKDNKIRIFGSILTTSAAVFLFIALIVTW
jgi:hypothetical protein